jgi:hypothetical protein
MPSPGQTDLAICETLQREEWEVLEVSDTLRSPLSFANHL